MTLATNDLSCRQRGDVHSRECRAGLLLCLLLTIVGCHQPLTETPAPDTAAVSGAYAPQDGVEVPFQPEASHGRRVHLLTRNVRHRHARPR
jgi:hypothetical protein